MGDGEPGSGIHSLSKLSDLSLVVAPDLYSPKPLVERCRLETRIDGRATFTRCVDLVARAVPPESRSRFW